MLGVAVAAVLAVTVVAFLLPAIRAARMSPIDGLRSD
jgi:ABC-type antimicrobial peptide transport system permease subunit